MPGYEDLDANGTWEESPDYGAVWIPRVAVGWAPYHQGHWAWVAPWGWTWVDDAPWGFAPFHYGRWAYYRNNWAWVPGPVVVGAPPLLCTRPGRIHRRGRRTGSGLGGVAVGRRRCDGCRVAAAGSGRTVAARLSLQLRLLQPDQPCEPDDDRQQRSQHVYQPRCAARDHRHAGQPVRQRPRGEPVRPDPAPAADRARFDRRGRAVDRTGAAELQRCPAACEFPAAPDCRRTSGDCDAQCADTVCLPRYARTTLRQFVGRACAGRRPAGRADRATR
ncbi:MAG: DUF6600 domain-containing protein [Pararobbsia sp.]